MDYSIEYLVTVSIDEVGCFSLLLLDSVNTQINREELSFTNVNSGHSPSIDVSKASGRNQKPVEGSNIAKAVQWRG